MRKVEIEGEVYRLPDKLNDFQYELFIHLIKWKWNNVTKEPGHFGSDDYDAILPESEHENLPHLYNQTVKDALAEHLGIFPFKLHRHFFHMASSQAANINLFLPILLHPLANEILKQLKPDFKCLATDELYHGFRLEFWDGNLDTERGSLGDHSAIAGTDSDIAIAYYNNEDKLCLWLIEHKLREDEFTECGGFKSKGKRDQHDCTKSFGEFLQNKNLCYCHDENKYKYWDITEENEAFFVNRQDSQSCPFKGGMNQLWRNQLLGFTLKEQKKYNEVYFSVVRHPENDWLNETIANYKKLIAGNPKFSDFTSRDVVDAASKFEDKELGDWVKWYRGMYKLKRYNAIVEKEILSISEYLQNHQLEIPSFQRPYKWTSKNVFQLLEDIHRFKSDLPYRIGTVVIHKDSNAYRIVDGQQRTITFLLILKAILTYKIESIEDVNLRNQINLINERLFIPRFKNDISKKNIQNNYLAIVRRLDNINESFINFFLNKCQVTYFVIDDVSEAFQFFDSQNSRGRDLEAHDLLKAYHLREMYTTKCIIDENEIEHLVEVWQNMDIKELANLFADFLYRVRGWSKGDSSRYFTKNDTHLFKGVNLDKIDHYPYTESYRYIDSYVNDKVLTYPFQLDQTIINGKYFFEMISYYKKVYDDIFREIEPLSNLSKEIMKVLNDYEGKNRTGDKYVRMLFDCALIFYVDKFGKKNISKAIEKIFIWAYKIRLTYQSLQLVSVDNYVVKELNIFKKIKEATYSEDIEMIELPMLENDYESDKTKKIKKLFIKMNYYGNLN